MPSTGRRPAAPLLPRSPRSPRHRTTRAGRVATLTLAVALGLTACSGHPSPGPTASSRPTTNSGGTTNPSTPGTNPSTPATNPAAAPRFLITAQALSLISGSSAARAQLDSTSTTVIAGRTGAGVPAGWNVTRAASFTSYARLKAMVEGGQLPAGTRTVLYDTEGWSLTPAAEQADPAHYLALAGQVAHAHGLTFIAAPAVDLTPKVSPGQKGYQGFLATGILAAAARSADVVVVQAQGSIPAPAKYSAFVRAAAQQIRAASSSAAVIAGLSTGPSGQTVSLSQLQAAADAGRGQVQGYWLNIPARGQYCPNCGPARPDLAEQFLARQPPRVS